MEKICKWCNEPILKVITNQSHHKTCGEVNRRLKRHQWWLAKGKRILSLAELEQKMEQLKVEFINIKEQLKKEIKEELKNGQ